MSQIIVNVSNLTAEEKSQINEAFAKITNSVKLPSIDPQAGWLIAPYTPGASDLKLVVWGFHTDIENPTHTPEEVLEMANKLTPQKGHPHAELMAQYAEDAKTSSKPWELWQIRRGSEDWISCTQNPGWDTSFEYRRKPKTHTVNGVEIPDLRFAPKEGKTYWLPAPSSENFVYGTTFGFEAARDDHRVAHKLCYEYTDAGKQAAILHAKAWLGIA